MAPLPQMQNVQSNMILVFPADLQTAPVSYMTWWPQCQAHLQVPETPRPGTSDSEAPSRITASSARRLRRKRAQERARQQSSPELTGELRGRVWSLTRHEQGCRVVQNALELGNKQAAELARELEGHVLEAAPWRPSGKEASHLRRCAPMATM